MDANDKRHGRNSEPTPSNSSVDPEKPINGFDVATTVSTASQPPTQTSSAPNGGLKAWIQVLGSWMLIFNAFGTIVTFGDYQTYYESGALFKASSSNISWIGSIQSLLLFVVGAVAGPVYDRGHLKFLIVFGGFCLVFGHMMLSLCHEYWQVLLAQGFVLGIGGGCVFVPALAILQPYFSGRLGLAVGLAATGSSIGGVVFPVMFTNLIGSVGFGWTTRIIGFVMLGTMLIPAVVSKQRVKPAGARDVIDVTAFRDGPFMFCIFCCFLGYIGFYVAFFYTSFFGKARGFTGNALSLYLVPIINGVSGFGRILPNWLSDWVGPINVIIPGCLLVGIILLCNLAVHNATGIICTAVAFGFLSGVFVATPPLLFVSLTKDKSKLGTRMGMAYAMIGLAVLPGGPGSGGVLQHSPDRLDWTAAWIYAGVTTLSSGLMFGVLRIWQGGLKIGVRV